TTTTLLRDEGDGGTEAPAAIGAPPGSCPAALPRPMPGVPAKTVPAWPVPSNAAPVGSGPPNAMVAGPQPAGPVFGRPAPAWPVPGGPVFVRPVFVRPVLEGAGAAYGGNAAVGVPSAALVQAGTVPPAPGDPALSWPTALPAPPGVSAVHVVVSLRPLSQGA